MRLNWIKLPSVRKLIRNATFALGAMLCAVASPASAQLLVQMVVPQPPYSPTINPGETTAIKITLSNQDTNPITNARFNLNLRGQANSGLSVVDAGGGNGGVLSYTCTNGNLTPATATGTLTATPGATSISLTGGQIPPFILSGQAGQCDITILVTSTAQGPNDFIIAPADVQGDVGVTTVSNGSAAPQTITVSPFSAPTFTKVFGASSIALGGATNVTLTIKNNGTVSLPLDSTPYGVRDNLPAGIVVHTGTPTLSPQCVGVTTAGTNGSTTFDLVGGSIAAGDTCTVVFPVRSTAIGAGKTNTINPTTDLKTSRGVFTTGGASANIDVTSSLVARVKFGDGSGSPLPNTQSSTFTVEIENLGVAALNQTGTFNGIPGRFDVNETVPRGLTAEGIIITGVPTATNCGGGASLTVDPDGKIYHLTGAVFPGGGICTLSFNYQGVLSTEVGTDQASQVFTHFIKPNDIQTVEGVTTAQATASITVLNSLIGDKFIFGPSGQIGQSGTGISMGGGQVVQYRLQMGNFGPGGKLVITDPLPGGMKAIGGPGDPLYPFTYTGDSPTGCVVTPDFVTDPTTPVFVYSAFPATGATDAQRCEFTFYAQLPLVLPSGGPDLTNRIEACHFRFGPTASSAGVGRPDSLPSSAPGNCALRDTGAPGTFIAPVAIGEAFSVATPVSAGTPVTLTYTLTNANGSALTSVAFSDTLPAGMSILSAAASQCGGTVATSIVSGQHVLTLTGGTLAARANGGLGPLSPGANQCTVVASVTGTPNVYNNDIPGQALSASQPQPVGSPLTVNSANQAVNATVTFVGQLNTTKSFSPSTVANGGQSRVTITLDNGSTGTYTAVKVIDPLTGTGLTLPSTVGAIDAQTTCGASPLITAPTNGTTATLENVTLPAGQQCTFSFNVITSTNPPSGWTNTIPAGNVTASGGISNITPVTATLTNASSASVSVGVTTNPSSLVAPGQKSTLTVTLTNPPGSTTTLTNLGVRDYLTADGTSTGADQGLVFFSTPNPQTTCQGGTVTVLDSKSFELTGATLLPNTSCTFQVDVTLLQLGGKVNLIPAGQVHNDQNVTNTQASTNIGLSGTIGVVKQFSPTVVKPNVTSRLTITLYNLLTEGVNGISFNDTLPVSPAGLVIASPANVATTCVNAVGGAVTPVVTGNSIGLSGASNVHLDAVPTGQPARTCTVSVDVVSPNQGAYLNTIPANNVQGITATSSTAVQNIVAADATLQVRSPVVISKTFQNPTRTPGQANLATITLTNPNNVALTGAFLTDNLVSGLFLTTTPAGATTCGSGVVVANPSGNIVQLTNGTIPASSSCTITFNVVSNVPATYNNDIPAQRLTTLMGVTNELPAHADFVVKVPPSVDKSFSPPAIPANGTSILTIRLNNTNGPTLGAATLNLPFTDTLPTSPSAMTVAAGAVGGTCTGAVTATLGSGTVTYASGSTIPDGGCTITVPVTAATVGTYTNTVPSNTLHTDFGDNVDPATADLVVSPLGFISGRVFRDNDLAADGSYQVGVDTPIANAVVTLSGTDYGADHVAGGTDDTPVNRTTQTNALGEYAFTLLSAGSYTVTQASQPAGTLNGVTRAGAVNGLGTGGAASNPTTTSSLISNIILLFDAGPTTTANSTDNNFAEVVGGTLSGFVYNDANDDGTKQGGETGIAGVTVQLFSGTTTTGVPLQTAVTDGAGAYSFTGLVGGTYSIVEVGQPSATSDGKTTAGTAGGTATLPGSMPSAITGIVLGSNVTSTANNFGEVTSASISGRIFKDINDNGAFDGADTGLAGVTVNLYAGAVASGTPVAVATTDTNGDYAFSGLTAGVYSIGEPTQPAATVDGKTTAGTSGGTATTQGTAPSAITNINLAAGVASTGNNFAEIAPVAPPAPTANITGRVYFDLNDNGLIDAGETGIPGVQVLLTGTDSAGGAVSLSVTTDGNGDYVFTPPASNPGGYTITELQPGAPDGKTTAPTGSATSAKPVATGGADVINGVVFGATSLTGYNFGERGGVVAVSGKVYRDLNDNGVVDPGEDGIAGVTVRLTGTDSAGAAVSMTTTTTSTGDYTFLVPTSNGAGYTITEVQPTDPDGKTTAPTGAATAGKPVATGGLDTITGVVVGTTPLTGYNFGERGNGARVTGYVFADANNNGVRDAGEAPIAGVTVTLTGTSQAGAPVSMTTTTGADGAFAFTDVPPSNVTGYALTETQPQGFADGRTVIAPSLPGDPGSTKPVAAGGNDVITGVLVAPGSTRGDYIFAELPIVGSRVTGYVFADANNNGVRESADTAIANVVMTLVGTSSTGAPVVLTTTTGPDGVFTFADVPPSDAAGYTLTEVQPSGVTDGVTRIATGQPGVLAGGKPILVGDQDRVTGVVVPANTIRGDYIFGERPIPTLKPPIVNGYVFFDRDHDRIRPTDGSVDGQAGWTVTLRQNGALICTTTTDAKGFYQFDNLHCPGYELSGLPTGTGFSITFDKDGTNLPAVPVSGGNRGTVTPTGGQILNITLNPGDQVVEQNLPLDPAGVIYNSVTRQPVPGATVVITGPPGFNPATMLVGSTAAQTQVVGDDGAYAFLLQSGFPSGVYTLTVTAPANYLPAPSTSIPACPGVLPVTLIPDPALLQANSGPPASSAPMTCPGLIAGGSTSTQYFFQFNITNGGSAPILNNHIPLDPVPVGALFVTKTTPMINVARGDLVPYTITVTNTETAPTGMVTVRDQLPPGFRYRDGSATTNGVKAAAVVEGGFVSWPATTFGSKEKKTFSLMLTVGAGVGDGDYVNRAWGATPAGAPFTNVGAATVRIVPDPTFDCPDIIGKVFDDRNANGVQEDGEPGIPAVRLATANGLLITSDAEGRFHVPCPMTPDQDRGSNFVLKLDARSLPSGFRLTTENPASIRVTRGKMVKLNFGATIHRVVRIELSDAAFQAGATSLLAEFRASVDGLPQALAERPSVVRLAYRGGADPGLVKKRTNEVRDLIRSGWKAAKGRYPLDVEIEGEQQ